jgi:outer membrane protein assembly factor BamB
MAALEITVLFAACGHEPNAPPAPSALGRLEVYAADSAVLTGHSLPLHVAAWSPDGLPITAPAVEWSVVGPGTQGSVDSSGLYQSGVASDVFVAAVAGPVADTIKLHVAARGEVKWLLPLEGVGMIGGGPAEGPDGTIYVLSFVASDTRGRLTAVRPNGTVRWQRDLTGLNHASYPMVGLAGEIYVAGVHSWAFSPSGDVLWNDDVRAPGLYEYPGMAGDRAGRLYSTRGGVLRSLDPGTGDPLWSSAPQGIGLNPPTVSGDGRTIYGYNSGTALVAFNAGTGVARWSAPDAYPYEWAVGTGPAIAGDRIIVPVAFGVMEIDSSGIRRAVSANLGRGVSEPAIGPDGTLYLGAQSLWALNPVTKTRWQFRKDPIVLSPSMYGGPALAAGGVLYTSTNYGFYAFNVSGSAPSVRWRYPADTTQSLAFAAAPLIGRDGTVYSYGSTLCDCGPTADALFAFWEDAPAEPNSPWPMWRHDARRSGHASR